MAPQDRIAALTEALTVANTDDGDVWNLLHRFEDLADRANDVLARRLVQIVITIGISYGVTSGLIGEGSIGGFQVKQIAMAIGFVPLLVAVMYYDAMIAAAHISLLEDAIRASYRVVSPAVEAANLHLLAYPPNFVGMEDLLLNMQGTSSALRRIVFGTSVVMLPLYFLGPLVVLGYASYLAIAIVKLPFAVVGILVALAWIIALRGLLVLVFALSTSLERS